MGGTHTRFRAVTPRKVIGSKSKRDKLVFLTLLGRPRIAFYSTPDVIRLRTTRCNPAWNLNPGAQRDILTPQLGRMLNELSQFTRRQHPMRTPRAGRVRTSSDEPHRARRSPSCPASKP